MDSTPDQVTEYVLVYFNSFFINVHFHDYVWYLFRFYDFWYKFKSWRDFKVDKDHDLERADGREERRWMEKENDRLRGPARKEEVIHYNY